MNITLDDLLNPDDSYLIKDDGYSIKADTTESLNDTNYNAYVNDTTNNQLKKKYKDPRHNPYKDQSIYNKSATKSSYIIPITKNGAFINFSQLEVDQNDTMTVLKMVRKIENYFTLKAMQIFGQLKQSKRCTVDKKKKRIIVPRFGVFEVLKKEYGLSKAVTKSQLKPGENLSKPFKWQASLTPNQQVITRHIMDNYYNKQRKDNGSAGLILQLEAGQGKSYAASWFIQKFQKKTAIILHSTSLVEQWVKVLQTCYDEPSIGYYYAKKKILGDIMLLIVKSATQSEFIFGKGDKTVKYSALEFYNMFGLIIFDECHTYANKSNGKLFSIAETPYMLGLSATPAEHPDKFDTMVWWGIGSVLNAKSIPGYQSTDQQFSGKLIRYNYYGPPKYTKFLQNSKTDLVSVVDTISMICDDPDRDDIIIDSILECIQSKRYTFVFADRRSYLEKLRTKLKARCDEDTELLIDDTDFARIVGGTKAQQLEHAELKSRVIFTTYQYMGTGKSIIKMNALVLATPRKSKMEQYIKRVFRLGSDMSIERIIYDIVDMKTVLKNQFYVRSKYYKQMGFDIISLEKRVE